MTAEQIAAACGGRLHGEISREWHLATVSTDSRRVRPGDVFVALRGEHFDGNEFIDDAIARGAALVLCETGRAPNRRGVAFVEVPDTVRALGDMAAAHRGRFDVPLVAITGSNGKTTTKELLRGILVAVDGTGCVLANEGNFNNLIGLPLTLLGLAAVHRVAVVEMGMNAPGEIARLVAIAVPTHGLVTCIAEAHLGGLGSLDAIARAKGEMFDCLPPAATALVNLDDPLVVREARRFRGAKLGFGTNGSVRAGRIEHVGLSGARFELIYGDERGLVDLRLGGRHNVMNAVAAAACARSLGVSLAAVERGLHAALPPPMRMSSERLANGVWLVNDAYNANPASLRAALAAVRETSEGRLLIVLGDMLELGERAVEIHERSGREVAAARPSLLCALGGFARGVCAGARAAGMPGEACIVAGDHDEAARRVAEVWRAGDTVLVKGSRGMHMERVVDALMREGTS